MTKHTRRCPSVLSAFTGLGGLDLGLELAGFRVAGCIEFDDNGHVPGLAEDRQEYYATFSEWVQTGFAGLPR